eukprot:c45459_g1_i1.p1 GENE.c45459_g1_i1~~c45459_g1_i1.p1  ORF type:complete len:409 (-),score=118.54 c45459_g1_i1:158-1384(-)
MSCVRVAIVGCGQMGVEHIKNLSLQPKGTIEIVALVDTYQQSLDNAKQEVLARHGKEPKLLGTVDELLESEEVDAFVIATPNFTHARVLRKVIPTGKHILVEKPLCTTLRDCVDIQKLARQSKAVLWVGMEYRYMNPIAQLIKEVECGTVGNLRMLAIREHRYPFLIKVANWNRFNVNTGGTMVEKCCHFFDLMCRIVGSRPISIYCNAGMNVNHVDEVYPATDMAALEPEDAKEDDGEVAERPAKRACVRPDIVDNSYTVLEFENGVRAMLDLCMFAEASRNQEELCAVGDQGKVEAFIPDSTVHIARRNSNPITHHPPKEDEKIQGQIEVIRMPVDVTLLEAGYHEGSTFFEQQEFLRAIANSLPAEVGVDEGVLSVMIGIAAERSARERRVVMMSEMDEEVRGLM